MGQDKRQFELKDALKAFGILVGGEEEEPWWKKKWLLLLDANPDG